MMRRGTEDVDKTVVNISVLIKKIKSEKVKRTIYSRTNTKTDDLSSLTSTETGFKQNQIANNTKSPFSKAQQEIYLAEDYQEDFKGMTSYD